MNGQGFFGQSFGFMIAFVAPGTVAVWGVAQLSPTVARWFGASAAEEVSGAGFLFVLLAALSTGVFLSGIRSLVLTRIQSEPKDLDEGTTRNQDVRAALNQAVEDFFRYHQFYGNMVFAVVIAYICWLASRPVGGFNFVLLLLVVTSVVILSFSAQYSLKRYREVSEQILGKKGQGP